MLGEFGILTSGGCNELMVPRGIPGTLIPLAVFISIYDSSSLYMYDRPLAAYQLSDGDLWFTTGRTTVRHDP